MDKQEVMDELAKRGVRLSIGGCGCCGSPFVSIQIDGVMVVDNQDDYRIDNTIEENKSN